MVNVSVNLEQRLVADCVEQQLTDVEVSVAPIARLLKQRILNASKGQIELQFELGEQFTQGNNVIQGGAASMTLDAGLAFCGMTLISDQQSVVTLNMQTQYFRPVKPGRVWVSARVDKPGRQVLFCSAELRDEQGKVLATAESPLMVINL